MTAVDVELSTDALYGVAHLFSSGMGLYELADAVFEALGVELHGKVGEVLAARLPPGMYEELRVRRWRAIERAEHLRQSKIWNRAEERRQKIANSSRGEWSSDDPFVQELSEAFRRDPRHLYTIAREFELSGTWSISRVLISAFGEEGYEQMREERGRNGGVVGKRKSKSLPRT